jgi:RNA polymerase sigma factor (sigma-70 family)
MLEKLATHHKLWVSMLTKLGCSKHLAEDIVQDMYLRLYRLVKDPKDIMYGDDVNRYYVWTTLRNMYYSHLKKASKNTIYPLLENDDKEDIEYNYEEDDAFQLLVDDIRHIISNWTVYDKRLFELYFIEGLSLRAISKGSKIGLTSIHNSIINYREELREHLSEDLMDYFNEDFDKICKKIDII